MRVIRQEEVLGAAYHEAGHAVVAYLLGCGIPDIGMEPDEETLGTCSFAVWADEAQGAAADGGDAVHAESAAAVSLAGPLAEELVTGVFNEEGAEDDVFYAIERAEDATPDEETREALLDRAHERAAALLEEHWDAVRALADELLRVRRMAAADVRAMVEAALAREA